MEIKRIKMPITQMASSLNSISILISPLRKKHTLRPYLETDCP